MHEAHALKLSFGSGGVGASHHLYGEMFKSLTDVQMTHVPYRRKVPALNDVIAGHIPPSCRRSRLARCARSV
jgi:tripartite-type tricarboxylate transporter receptor subunit TctC